MKFDQTPQNIQIVPPEEKIEIAWFKEGDLITYEEEGEIKKSEVLSVEPAQNLAQKFGINLQRNIPAYVLRTPLGRTNGAYSFEKDIVFFYPHTTEIVMKHELIHAVERPQTLNEDLQEFFDKVRKLYPYGLERNGAVLNNFLKNIHEFIAECYTNPVVIEELKGAGLYDDFLRQTKYLNIFL